MTDWDPATVEPEDGNASSAFVLLGAAILLCFVWVISQPGRLIANLNRRSHALHDDHCRTDCDAGVEAADNLITNGRN